MKNSEQVCFVRKKSNSAQIQKKPPLTFTPLENIRRFRFSEAQIK